MTSRTEIAFVAATRAPERTLVVLAAADLTFGSRTRALIDRTGGHVARAADAAEFTGKSKTVLEVLAPAGIDCARLLVVGIGQAAWGAHAAGGSGAAKAGDDADAVTLGGQILGQLASRKVKTASLMVEFDGVTDADAAVLAADIALGAQLRGYTFDKYMTKKTDDAEGKPERDGVKALKLHVASVDSAQTAFERRRALAAGVGLARDLVNEPANTLGPVEFADRLLELEKLGVEVDVLDVPALEALKMNALLGVGKGSVRPSRVVVMQWHGGAGGGKAKRGKPVCIIGKGVVFDTGGLSIKPAAGMEDMKGDMGGAACVAGLMHTLAARKAHVNVVGLVGLVENMPSGSAQRPGDIITSMSGQTIEVINTDAEGRLVLADVITYAETRFKPKLIVDLATLTGAIMVALGKEYAGLFSNDDKLAQDLFASGEATGERVWRMPLAKAYDKMIDSKFADMKNIGGRFAGSITAAQFLQRFITDTPWAHLDVAGVAMDSNRTDINQSWGSGWGVRLLDHYIAERHEKNEK